MLGVKRIGNNQIDLWQGDPLCFFCDRLFDSTGSLQSSSIEIVHLTYNEKATFSFLEEEALHSTRHFAVFIYENIEWAELLIAHISRHFSKNLQTQKRATLIVLSGEAYQELQAGLLKVH